MSTGTSTSTSTTEQADRPRRPGDRRRRRTGPPASFVVVATGLFVLAQVVAVSTWWPIHRSGQLVVLVAVTLLVGSALGVAGAVRRLSSAWLAAGTVVAFLVLGVPLAVPDAAVAGLLPTGRGLLDLVTGVALGWKQLLTISLPVGSYQALLVPVFVLLLVGTVVGVSVALRTRSGEVAAVVPVVTWLAGIVLGPSEAFLPTATALALLAVLVTWSMWWRLRRRRLALDALAGTAGGTGARAAGHGAAVLRAVAGGATTVVVAGAVAAGAVALVPPTGSRLVARDAVEQPFDPRDDVSPLTRFRAYQQQPAVDEVLFTVSGAPDGALLRLATLDTYDGVAYTVGSGEVDSASGSFTRVPSEVDQSDVRGRAVSVDVAVGDWSSTWLPTLGRLEGVRFTSGDAAELRDAFYYNDVSGTAAVLGGLRPGDAYRLDAVLPDQPDEDDLASARPGPESVPEPQAVPAQVREAARAASDGADGPGAALLAALTTLREEGYVSHGVGEDEPVSRSGHGADRIAQLFDDPVMIGDAEQYATAAALVADELGFPARVVMGFRAQADGAQADGAPSPVTGDDVTAWIEVDTARYGWVALDPNPQERPVPEDQVQDPTQVSRPESVVQPPPQDPQIRDAQSPPQSERETPDAPPAWLAVLLAVVRVAGWVLLVAAVLAAPFVAVVAAKARRRRRRRRRTDPVARIAGGWEEFEDAVVDHGIPTPPAGTRHEIATAVGSSRAVVLARVADRAVFAPGPPGPEDADRVWTAVTDMRASLSRGLPRWQRFKAAVSPRSLRRYHGRTPPRR